MNNKDYVLLLIAFSVGLGIFTTVMTLINQLVAIHDYRYCIFLLFEICCIFSLKLDY